METGMGTQSSQDLIEHNNSKSDKSCQKESRPNIRRRELFVHSCKRCKRCNAIITDLATDSGSPYVSASLSQTYQLAHILTIHM